jgi:PhzF family phenazine biosynthesis protein
MPRGTSHSPPFDEVPESSTVTRKLATHGLADGFACKMTAMRVPLFHVDAFTGRPFSGNPAAVCPLQAWLDDGLLLKVAAENNLSETAFFVPRDSLSKDLCYDLRWFTPSCEVRLCGHATLASAYVVLNLLHPGIESVRFETRFSGALTVRKDGKSFAMDLPAIFAKPCANPPDALIRALGPGHLPATVLEANDTYIAVYENESAVRNVRPDFALLEQLHPFAVSITGPGVDGGADFVSRYFAPSYGIPEDPVTGSAHCLLTPYWARRLGKTALHARQVSERGGELWCEMAGQRVIIKGGAVLTLEGTLAI